MDNPGFFRMHRIRLALSQVKGPVRGTAMQRNPQHFHRACTGSVLLRTSHPHVCAQPAGKQSSCRAGRQQPINALVLAWHIQQAGRKAPDLGLDEVMQECGPGCLPPPPKARAEGVAAPAPTASGRGAAV